MHIITAMKRPGFCRHKKQPKIDFLKYRQSYWEQGWHMVKERMKVNDFALFENVTNGSKEFITKGQVHYNAFSGIKLLAAEALLNKCMHLLGVLPNGHRDVAYEMLKSAIGCEFQKLEVSLGV